MKLYLKSTRCFTAKCAIAKRESVPGMHAWRRGKPSDYFYGLREKQKLKRFYGLREKQFRRFFAEASRMPGNTGEALLVMLERRLDNVLYVGGFALSRGHARQMIGHGHMHVNGHKVDVPSYLVSQDDVIVPKDVEESKNLVKEALEVTKDRARAAWLEIKEEPLQLRVLTMPSRADVTVEAREQLVVELLSK
jgi:small subunit ribosomal protein S4